MQTYETLSDLLAAHGSETPHALGRALYKAIDCGPWLSFQFEHGALYYEDAEAHASPEILADNPDFGSSVSVSIGSIVEGSDAEVGPYILTFPFSSQEWDDRVKQVNDEAVAYWHRDNCTWGEVISRAPGNLALRFRVCPFEGLQWLNRPPYTLSDTDLKSFEIAINQLIEEEDGEPDSLFRQVRLGSRVFCIHTRQPEDIESYYSQE